ncbi:MAG: hypothetical protein IJZ23_05600 [Roseburia sp.]|nr:hypothetical protein [Roseburia sp.]
MKKRILSLLLVAIMACSICACGGSETSNNDVNNDKQNNASEQTEEEIRIEEGEHGLVVYLSRKQLKESLTKVTITKENWKEYFADYYYIEHVVQRNDFGDIESEGDILHCGFGIKRDICAVHKKVSFKFDGMTRLEGSGTAVYEAGNNKVKIYDMNGEFLKEKDCESKEYYLAELSNYDGVTASFYEEHECIDVLGEIIIIDLPFEEPYDGQINIEFTDGGNACSNMMNYSFWSKYLEE